jgi:hypothetical protein
MPSLTFDAATSRSDMVAIIKEIVAIPSGKELAILCGKKTTLILPLDLVLFDQMCKMDESKSMKNEKLSKNHFNAWRASINCDASINLLGLPLEEFADLLT